MPCRALIVALALTACATPPPAEAPDADTLHIEIGRYGYMLYQLFEVAGHRYEADEPLTAPVTMARRLREIVWRYNADRTGFCRRGVLRDVTCGPAFSPEWLNERHDAAPSLEEIAARAAAVGAVVVPFWEAVCADMRQQAPEEERSTICAIE